MEFAIEKARAEDADAILALLAQTALPLDGIRDHLETAIVARLGGDVVGVAALEVYRDGVLMRSVAVSPALQGHGLGRQLTDAVLQLAREVGASHAYLLTTTAERYFPEFGFERIEREDVPASVQASIEFRSACPSSAVAMRKSLTALTSTITCPACGHATVETMPLDRCVFFYECPRCKAVLKPRAGDCCVFCSYGDRRCPFVQDDRPCPG